MKVARSEGGAFWRNRTTALTGATGFVGSHLASQLRERGARVIALVRAESKVQRLLDMGIECRVMSLDDVESIESACRDCEYLFHTAGAVDFSDNRELLRQVNVEGTHNVVTAARKAGVSRVVHTSSIVAVGASKDPLLLSEDTNWNLARTKVAYVVTKRMAEERALAGNGRGLEVVVVNPASIVGPDDYSGSEFGILCKRFWRGQVPFHFGGGNNFVDVRDVALGHILAAERGKPGRRYILGGENRTYTAFFGDLSKVAGRTIPRLRLPSAFVGVVASIEKLTLKRDAPKYVTGTRGNLVDLYFWFSSERARTELGYSPRQLQASLTDAYHFWTRRKAA